MSPSDAGGRLYQLTTEKKAHILLQEINDALARGTKHYDLAGRELTTPEAIIKALLLDGSIQFSTTNNREVLS